MTAAGPSSAPAYRVAPVEYADCADAMREIWLTSLEGMTVDGVARKLNHLYPHNPSLGPVCLALSTSAESASDKMVGVLGLLPRRWHHQGQSFEVATLVDFAVTPAHRTLGPAVQLMREGLALARQRFAFTYGRPNRKSQAVCKRTGMKSAGEVLRYVKLLRSREPLQRWARARFSDRLANWLASCLAPPVDIWLWSMDRLRGAGQPLAWREIALQDLLEPASAATRAIDELWQACHRLGLCLGERTAPYLHWRLAASFVDWRVALASSTDGQTIGYVAWRHHDGMLSVGDFLCREPLQQTAALLRQFARYARRLNARAIDLEFLGHIAVTDALADAGFKPRPGGAPIFTSHGRTPTVADSSNWYITSFDGDAD